jgi:3-oxoadipate enol-lactonase
MTTESWIDAAPDARLFYTTDDYTDPWSAPESVLLVYGLAESGRAWNACVPHLARRYRVLRIDQQGFGASTPVRRDFTYTLDTLGNDLASLIEKEARGPVHVVGAKIGATISAHFAARRPDLAREILMEQSRGARKRPCTTTPSQSFRLVVLVEPSGSAIAVLAFQCDS